MGDGPFIGDIIRQLRDQRGLSQLGLHRLTGLSQSTLYRAEAGGIVTDETARRLAPVLGCPASELLPPGRS